MKYIERHHLECCFVELRICPEQSILAGSMVLHGFNVLECCLGRKFRFWNRTCIFFRHVFFFQPERGEMIWQAETVQPSTEMNSHVSEACQAVKEEQ